MKGRKNASVRSGWSGFWPVRYGEQDTRANLKIINEQGIDKKPNSSLR